MHEFAVLLAVCVSLGALYGLHRWWLPYALLAVVQILDHPEPEHQRISYSVLGKPARELTVADVRWGASAWPAVWMDLV